MESRREIPSFASRPIVQRLLGDLKDRWPRFVAPHTSSQRYWNQAWTRQCGALPVRDQGPDHLFFGLEH